MAQSIGLNSPNSYRLISAVISNNEGNQIDVSNLVDSFQLTESIYQMFLTGNIVIADNINVFNRLNITGQEYLRLHFSGIQGNEEEVPDDEQINQVFRIFNVSTYVRDTSTDLSKVLYSLDFCSPLLYEARTKRISRVYRGKSGDILNKICKEELNFVETEGGRGGAAGDLKPRVKGGQEVGNYFSIFNADKGDVSGFLCPNWTVYKTLEWLRDNTSEDDSQPYGDSYYFFQTALNGFRFMNVEQMYNISYLDGAVEFSPRDGSMVNSDNYDYSEGVGNDILSYNKVNLYDTLLAHQSGLYAGTVHSYDTVTKTITVIPSQFTQQFEIENNEYKKGLAVAPSFRFGAENIRVPDDGGGEDVMGAAQTAIEGDSIIDRFGAAVNFGYNVPYTFSNKAEDVGNSITSGGSHVKFNRQRVESLFESNRVNIQIPARTNISAGMVIQVKIPMPTPAPSDREELQHNGRLLVESITWKGSRSGLEVQLSCTTDGHQVNPDTFEGMTLDSQY
jgi:hypothetical protein|tara:strand:- start:28 stop:1545 length:1518 start_codon:yes stop_codon:yes gene_type:complete